MDWCIHFTFVVEVLSCFMKLLHQVKKTPLDKGSTDTSTITHLGNILKWFGQVSWFLLNLCYLLPMASGVDVSLFGEKIRPKTVVKLG